MLENKNCNYCGWKFPADFPQNIAENSDSVFCENCGTEIFNSNDYPINNINKSQIKAKVDSNSKRKNKKKSRVSRIYEKVRIEKDPIDKMLGDSDFPLIFKENFNIVICRIIFDSLRDLVDISQLKADQIELSETLISQIEDNLEPTMNMKINDAFLTNLHKIPRKVFENHLRRFQSKIKRSTRFRNNFKIFLRWLINMVYELVSYNDEPESLPKFEQTILKDLRNFNIENFRISQDLISDEFDYNLNENQLKLKENSRNNNIIKIEKEFLRNKNIIYEELKSRWEWMNHHPELIVQFIKEVIIPDLVRKRVIKEADPPMGIDLEKNGFKAFYKALRNRKIRYTTLIKQMGLKPSMDFDRWKFLRKDEFGNHISFEKKIEKALEYLQKVIIPDLVDQGIIKKNETPKQYHLEKNSYGGFMAILIAKNPKVTYNELLREGGFKLNLDPKKWIFLDFGPSGQILSRSERINKIINYLKDIIIPDLIEKRILKSGQIPKYKDLRSNGHVNFLSAIESRYIPYNAVLKALGFNLRHDNKKFDFLRKDEEGNPFDREQSLLTASNYLIKTIIPNLVGKGIIAKNEVPKQSQLEDGGYKGFLNFLLKGKYKITYNKLLIYSGIDINYDPNVWRFIDYDDNNEKQTRENQIKAFSKFLTEKIIPNLQIKRKIPEGHAPTTGQLERNGHSNFINAYLNRDIFYEEIINAGGLQATETRILSRIGTYLHWILEYLFLKNTRLIGGDSFYEISPSKQSERYSLRKCDNAIMVNDNFQELSKLASVFAEIHQNTKMITIDYHFGSSLSDIRAKCFRSYQSSNKFLFIVSLTAKGPLPTPLAIPFRSNVQVIDTETFLDFFGFSSNLIRKILRSIKLAKSAMYKKKNLNKLKKLALKALSTIKISFNFSQIELEGFLRSKNQLFLLNYIKDLAFQYD